MLGQSIFGNSEVAAKNRLFCLFAEMSIVDPALTTKVVTQFITGIKQAQDFVKRKLQPSSTSLFQSSHLSIPL